MFSKLNRMENVKETSNPSESKDDVEHLEFDPPEMEKISSIPVYEFFKNHKYFIDL